MIGGEISISLKSIRLDCSIPEGQDISLEDESGYFFHVCCRNNPELINKLEKAIMEVKQNERRK